MTEFPKEEYYGNVEYKVILNKMNASKISKYATQLKFRLNEGEGVAFYYIGVTDSGQIKGIEDQYIDEQIDYMNSILSEIKASIKHKKIVPVKNKKSKLIILEIEANYSLDNIFLTN